MEVEVDVDAPASQSLAAGSSSVDPDMGQSTTTTATQEKTGTEQPATPEHLVCNVCRDLFRNPVTPPCKCGGSVCQDCWVQTYDHFIQYRKKKETQRGTAKLNCPHCGGQIIGTSEKLRDIGVTHSLKVAVNVFLESLSVTDLAVLENEDREWKERQKKVDTDRREKLKREREKRGPKLTRVERELGSGTGRAPNPKRPKPELPADAIGIKKEKWQETYPDGYFRAVEQKAVAQDEEAARRIQAELEAKAAEEESARKVQEELDAELARKEQKEFGFGDGVGAEARLKGDPDEQASRRLALELQFGKGEPSESVFQGAMDRMMGNIVVSSSGRRSAPVSVPEDAASFLSRDELRKILGDDNFIAGPQPGHRGDAGDIVVLDDTDGPEGALDGLGLGLVGLFGTD